MDFDVSKRGRCWSHEVAAQDVASIAPVVNVAALGSSYNPFFGSRPPSIHDAASSDESSLSDEDEGEMSEARRRRKEKKKAKIEKKARKLMKKRIKDEKKKKHSSACVKSLQLRATTIFLFSISIYPLGTCSILWWDGLFQVKMHLYGLHPSIWEVVCVGVIPSVNGVPTHTTSHIEGWSP